MGWEIARTWWDVGAVCSWRGKGESGGYGYVRDGGSTRGSLAGDMLQQRAMRPTDGLRQTDCEGVKRDQR